MLNKKQIAKAKKYMGEWGYEHGICLFYEGEQYGWKNALRNPEAEKPGAIAVDINGNQWVAIGGDDYNGATHWQRIAVS